MTFRGFIKLSSILSAATVLGTGAGGPASAFGQRAQTRTSVPKARPSTARPQDQKPWPFGEGYGGDESRLRTFALRLRPGQDLKAELLRFAKARELRAGFVMTTVGSLRKVSLRFADQSEATTVEEKFEIVSLVGTLAADGAHLHLSVSDKGGRTVGGHLTDGCIIYTTAEIVIGELTDLVFTRKPDAQTGYDELVIRPLAR